MQKNQLFLQLKILIENSECGLTADELEKKLNLKPNEVLLKLIENKDVARKKLSGKYVYFSNDTRYGKRQELLRKDSLATLHIGEMKPEKQ